MTLDELLKVKQLNYYINASEFEFFSNKNRDATELKIIFETDLSEYLYMQGIQKPEIDCFNPNNKDAFMTAIQGNLMKTIISLNKQKINTSSLTVFLGGLSQKYLTWILDAEKGKHTGRDEFCYADGEIVVIDENRVTTNNPAVSYIEIKSRLAEGVLIASNQFSQNKRPYTVNGTYIGRGFRQNVSRENFSSDRLSKFSKTQGVISSLDPSKFPEYVKSGIIKKWDVIKYINKQILPKDIAIDLMVAGIISPREVYEVLHIKSDKDLPKCDKIKFASKLLLYSAGKIKIDDLEKAAKHEEKRREITLESEDISKIAKYYKGNINKISELLTHNVLDFSLSMSFLDSLVQQQAITDEDRTYLVNIMNDFKVSELLNETENEKFGSEGSGTGKTKTYTNGVTIDPNIRKEYFKSIGDVKEIFINGQRLISDESDGVTEKNSLDGYQLIIIPDKKIAVLEKFYEVKRNKEGKIEYKTDKKGNLIAATEQATYIMPIAMAKDFAEQKNKQQLIKSPYVSRTFHSMNWTKNTEEAMKKVARRTGLDIEFNRENTDKWADMVRENYMQLREQRNNSLDELV